MSEVILVKAVQTCTACPSQWDAWDLDGRYWYLRYRSGHGGMGHGYDYCDERMSFENYSGPGGEISLAEFCERAGVTYAPELSAKVTAWQPPP